MEIIKKAKLGKVVCTCLFEGAEIVTPQKKGKRWYFHQTEQGVVEIWVNLPVLLLEWLGEQNPDHIEEKLNKGRRYNGASLLIKGLSELNMTPEKGDELMALVAIMQAHKKGEISFWVEFYSTPVSLSPKK